MTLVYIHGFFLLKSKSEVSTRIKYFIIFAKIQFDSSVKIVRMDNGLEFNLVDFYSSRGIVHQRNCS